EVLDLSLKTSQVEYGFGEEEEPRHFDYFNPFRDGWGWWVFDNARIYDERIVWKGDFVPAGTYELVYTLVLLQPGDFQVIPARAWQSYFPEVQGSSAGVSFSIMP
ncbi:MAG: hypothetical protein OEY93_06920, partial [Anaerolineae bacterium]|nr:hypothetical protein [Anaerolineae bacterium]